MAEKIVLSTKVIETRQGGVEIRVAKLSAEAKRALSTAGAEIKIEPSAKDDKK